MKTKSFSPVGSLHPILFFAVVYIVALFLSIFICSSIFRYINEDAGSAAQQLSLPMEETPGFPSGSTVAMR